jgi:exodeoxyribonuclease V gamma subunit
VLHIHRAARADALADALATLLAAPLDDAFAAELVAVPTRGMERWLTQRMSAVLGASPGQADGVCANVRFPSPHRLVGDAVAVAAGIDPAEDPWLPERAVWALLEVVDQYIGEPWLQSLAAYLGRETETPDPVRGGRRLSALRHIVNLFDRYALHRPGMLEAWAAGSDRDSTGTELAPGAAWQAQLWRRLRARIALPGPAERRARACARLREDATLVALPARLALFGLTRLPTGHFEVLDALAHRRDVHLYLLHPSPALWNSVARRLARSPRIVRRAADPSAELPANRLLASWGRDAREMQLVLAARDPHVDHDHDHDHDHDPAPGSQVEDHHDGMPGSRTLLGRIQDDVRTDRAPAGVPVAPDREDTRPSLHPDDRSIQVHSCHGRVRQVEVIRDAILHALAADRSLEPRDVIVMCPDIETFAPLIGASFGAGEPAADEEGSDAIPDHLRPIDLRVRLADRSLRQTNPVLGAISQLLELAGQRLTASEVLDFADRGPVRRRFRFDDDDLTRLQDWISQAGIRWGLDAAHRAPFKLDGVDNGTWRTGLSRLLLGVTMTEDAQRLFAGVLPLDDVDSRSIDLAGRFAELIARLGQAIDALSAPQPLAAWAEAIAEAADALTATTGRERWQRAELQRVLDEIVDEAGGSASPELAPAELRTYLAQRLQGHPTRANFRTGHLTVCTLLPMRSVPHRVVCLLGLDDGAFPRKAPRDGDDLMLDDPHVGERDPRSEDRQLLLDALLAATEQLIITYTGNDERTNTPRPAAVPVGELLDLVDATVQVDGGPAREQVLVRHPLQPFDPRNFSAGKLAGAGRWSFDPVTLAGARALSGVRAAPRPFLDRELAPRRERVLELEDLVRFVERPVRAFLRQRLGISLGQSTDEIEDGLLVELDGLQRWGVGQRLLEARLGGVEGRTAALAEIARGTLPPGVLGLPVMHALYPIVDAIVTQAHKLAPDAGTRAGADPVDVRVDLDDGRLLSGTVAGVSGEVLLTTTFSRVSARHRLATWVRLLALTASWPERAFSAATVGRASGQDDVRIALVGPLSATTAERRAAALGQLGVLVDLYDRGMREPLPIFCMTSAAYAEAGARGQNPVTAAEREWLTDWKYDREDRELEHQLVLGGVLSFGELLEPAPRPDEMGTGWSESEESRFGRYAHRTWDGLLAREQLSSR